MSPMGILHGGACLGTEWFQFQIRLQLNTQQLQNMM